MNKFVKFDLGFYIVEENYFKFIMDRIALLNDDRKIKKNDIIWYT